MEHFTFTSSASAVPAVGRDQEQADVGVLLTACCTLLRAVWQGLCFTGRCHYLLKGLRHCSVQDSSLSAPVFTWHPSGFSCSLQLEHAREAEVLGLTEVQARNPGSLFRGGCAGCEVSKWKGSSYKAGTECMVSLMTQVCPRAFRRV